jgi:hypothetical protein
MSTQNQAKAQKTRAAVISIFQRNPNRPHRALDISASLRATAAKEGWEPLEALAQLINIMHKESKADPGRYGGTIERVSTGRYQFNPPFFSPQQPNDPRPVTIEEIKKMLKEWAEAITKTLEAKIQERLPKETEEKQ